jgi:hypothetical protein
VARGRDIDRRGEGGTGIVPTGFGVGVKAALMRWVLQKRRGLQLDTRPTAQDEATHAWDGRRRFAEDYTFAAVQDGLALLVRLEWLSGRDAHRLWVVVLRADGSATCAWHLADHDALVPRGAGDRWRVGGLALDCLRPHREWSVRYEGRVIAARSEPAAAARCELDLVFTSDLDPYVPGVDDDPELIASRLGEAHWDAALLRAVRKATQRGYVQLGRTTGTLALGDELVPIRADTLRQHTWGVRDWGATRRGEQLFLSRPDGARTWVHRAEFPAFTLEGGFTTSSAGARAIPVRGVELESRPAEHGVPAHAEVGVVRGDSHVRDAFAIETRAEVSFPVDGRGALSVGLVRVGGADDTAPGWGLWAAQSRTLPWPRGR